MADKKQPTTDELKAHQKAIQKKQQEAFKQMDADRNAFDKKLDKLESGVKTLHKNVAQKIKDMEK